MGLFGWQFAKKNVALISVGSKVDPPRDTPAEKLLPEHVGDFTRGAINGNFSRPPGMGDSVTSSISVAEYRDQAANEVTVIAVPTGEAISQRNNGFDPFMIGRGQGKVSDTAVSIRNPYTGANASTMVKWSKENWTFLIQTTSTLANSFVEDFQPGGMTDTETGTTNTETSGTPSVSDTPEPTPAGTTPPEETPAPTPEPVTPAAPPTETTFSPQ